MPFRALVLTQGADRKVSGAIESLDLALLVDTQHNGRGRPALGLHDLEVVDQQADPPASPAGVTFPDTVGPGPPDGVGHRTDRVDR